MPPKIIGTYHQLIDIVEHEDIDKIIVALSDSRGLPMQVLLACKQRGVEIEEGAAFHEKLCGKVILEKLRPSQLIFSSGFDIPPVLRMYKRGVDILIAVLGLLLFCPLMVLIAGLIKLDSRGPALYTQERVGEKSTNFILLKFRSMHVDAEAGIGPVFTDENDYRITRIGRFLRTTRLDELPQLFNVLLGTMSFVGPRPERPFFVEQYEKEIPYYAQRLSVKPGITGWAQINYPYGSNLKDAKEKLQFDLFYVKNASLFFDLVIILKTMKIALLGHGAR